MGARPLFVDILSTDMTTPPPPVPSHNPPQYRLRPEVSAWVILVFFFGVSLVGLFFVGRYAWLGYTTSMKTQDGALLRGHVQVGVLLQSPRALTSRAIERLPENVDPCSDESDICVPLRVGDRIKTLPSAGYGPVASLVLPDTTHVQLWAQGDGSDLLYQMYQVSRWNARRQVVNLVHSAGYARYDVAQYQSYQVVEYSVTLPNGYTVWMSPGGSYSVNVLTASEAQRRGVVYEVAVRSGSATMTDGNHNQSIQPGQISEVTLAGDIIPARIASWQLLGDPTWNDIQVANQTITSAGWQLYQRAGAPNMSREEQNGRISVVSGCSPTSPDLCTAEQQTSILRFRREGTQMRPFAVGIKQTLSSDVSEYTSLRLTAWVRVLTQTVPLSGIADSECPISFQLTYKFISPSDQQMERVFCLYAFKSEDTLVQDNGSTRYRSLPPYEWYRLDVDLREDEYLRFARYLQEIRIEAYGHDYLAEITDISLVGKQ
jgi:hypothetical protein